MRARERFAAASSDCSGYTSSGTAGITLCAESRRHPKHNRSPAGRRPPPPAPPTGAGGGRLSELDHELPEQKTCRLEHTSHKGRRGLTEVTIFSLCAFFVDSVTLW